MISGFKCTDNVQRNTSMYFRLTNMGIASVFGKRVSKIRAIYPLYPWQLHIFIYFIFGFCCNLNTLIPVYTVWNLITDLSWFTVAFVSRKKFRNLSWNITAGFTRYTAQTGTLPELHSFTEIYSIYPLRTSGHSSLGPFLSRLVIIFFLWNILQAHHLGDILVNLTRFIPTFLYGNLFICLSSYSSYGGEV